MAAFDIECEAIRKNVIGYAPGEYCNRPVIILRLQGRLFGEGRLRKDRLVKLTLHNGIINHASLRVQPTVHWVVMDAISELKQSFTRRECIDKALETLKNPGRRKACDLAFKFYRNHHLENRQKYKPNMSHVVYDHMVRGVLKMSVRGRKLGDVTEKRTGGRPRLYLDPTQPILTTVVREFARG